MKPSELLRKSIRQLRDICNLGEEALDNEGSSFMFLSHFPDHLISIAKPILEFLKEQIKQMGGTPP